MSRFFVSGSTQYLINNSAVVTTYPITMGCLFNAGSISGALIGVHRNGSNEGERLQFGTPNQLLAVSRGSAFQQATTTSVAIGIWYSGIGVFPTASLRHVYINGVNKATNAGLSNIAAVDRTRIVGLGGNQQLYDGSIYLPFIFNATLTDAEVWMLGKLWWSPRMLIHRRKNLVFYPPLDQEHGDRDIVGGFHLTPVNGPTWAANPPNIIYPPSHLHSARQGIIATPSVLPDPIIRKKIWVVGIPRIPRIPATYNTLQIY